MMRIPAITAALLISLTCCSLRAEPTTDQSLPDFAVTPMRVQQLAGSDHFVYGETQTTLEGIKEAVDGISTPIRDAGMQGKIHISGPMTITMIGVTGDKTTPFKLRVGFPVRGEGTPPANTQMGKLESIRSACTVFSGEMRNAHEGYMQLYSELSTAGLEPSGEMRQTILYFESPDSANNVMLLQVGVK